MTHPWQYYARAAKRDIAKAESAAIAALRDVNSPMYTSDIFCYLDDAFHNLETAVEVFRNEREDHERATK